ncbi:DUF5682 family protein [Streptomyces sp. NPDC127106]|uniref:DUF5682 family protein n=1 Tax=Streptomyces sp. NPDC127106 TaxID=3345360 RepID=UPI003640F61E
MSTLTAHFLGVRHHSPACARLVSRTIAALRPSHVLVEGPADLNDRLGELLLGHRLPIAVFSHYRDAERTATSWTPFCDYSPEWVALTEGRAAGAQVRFIDLPAWHPAFAGRSNRYADAEARYERATARLCDRFGVDSADALWDRMFEAAEPGGQDDQALAERLALYFDVVRGDTGADASDRAREEYMASWVRAALAEPGAGNVLVVTGGFHRPALVALSGGGHRGTGLGAADPEAVRRRVPAHGVDDVRAAGTGAAGGDGTPAVPRPGAGALAGSHLVPYSFRQLDSFTGYQSGMPSPGFHQHVWEHGPAAAGEMLVQDVTERLRGLGRHVSTAALIAARATAQGLAALRGHHRPARLDLLDGLAGALLDEAVDQPLPWTRRGPLHPGTHPVLVEMVAAGRGERTGRLHPDTPVPPIVHDVTARLAALGLDGARAVTLRLTEPGGLAASRVLHCLRVLGVPGYARTRGPVDGADPEATERWKPCPDAGSREAALIEASGLGRTLEDATATALGEQVQAAGGAPDLLAQTLFDAVVCGATGLLGPLLAHLRAAVDRAGDPALLGGALHTAIGLWRHDRVYGVAGDPLLAGFVDAAVARVLWLTEGLHGPGGLDRGRLRALTAVRDAVLHAAPLLSLDRAAVTAVCGRISADPAAPADLRGAAFGLCRALGDGPGGAAADAPAGAGAGRAGGVGDAAAAVRAVAGTAALGDWLAGLFALAREELTAPAAGPAGEDRATVETAGGADGLLGVLDALVTEQPEEEFLAGLPALRQAFAYFPPRERERIAARLIERRGVRGSARGLLRTPADPLIIARARRLEHDVCHLLDRYGLGAAP